VLDGWWLGTCRRVTGWAIGSRDDRGAASTMNRRSVSIRS
jgi:hypothetical protein